VICGAGPIGPAAFLCARGRRVLYSLVIITDLASSSGWASRVRRVARFLLLIVLGWTRARAYAACRTWRSKRGSRRPDRRTRWGARSETSPLACTVAESSIAAAIAAVRFGRTVSVVGVGKSEMMFPFMRMSTREVDVWFRYRYANTWPRAIWLVASERRAEAGHASVSYRGGGAARLRRARIRRAGR